MASFLAFFFMFFAVNVKAKSPSLRRMQSCSFENPPATSYFWDPVGCKNGGLGCNADGQHIECRWCDHGRYVECPTSDSTPVPATPAPACTPNNRDPWATGSKMSCCSTLQECLGDHTGSGRWFYRCLESCQSKPATTQAPATPAPTPAPATPTPACTPNDRDPWASGSKVLCCNTLQECLGDYTGSGRLSYRCLNNCEGNPATTQVPTGTDGKVRLLSFNVWHGNNNFEAIADLIQDQVNPDIVNLQEAVNHQPDAIVAALNAKGSGQWSLANTFSSQHFWCGLNVYRSDKWDIEWRQELSFQGDRGICGARLRRKSDGKKMCVWGTHPLWRNGAPARYAQEAVQVAAAAMNDCSAEGAASALMCDCNTNDANAVRDQLQTSTGWQWAKAHIDGYDHIYVETAPQSVGSISGGTTIAPRSGQRGCQSGCQNPSWAFADHPPVFVDVSL